MRTILLAAVLSACTPTASPDHPRPINVAAVRHEIQSAEAPGHAIVSMGHVTPTSAVVYTDVEHERTEETWVRDGSGWRLTTSQRIASDL